MSTAPDELDAYLELDEIDDIDLDVLHLWKKRASDQNDSFYNLGKFVRQYLATPASSAGVERLFSRAGRLHSDLRSSMADETLKHMLFAAVNTD